MINFLTKDLVFVDFEHKQSARYRKKKEYYIYEFKDKQTRRMAYVYDWGVKDKDKKKSPVFKDWAFEVGKQYQIEGKLNTVGKAVYLVIDKATETKEVG